MVTYSYRLNPSAAQAEALRPRHRIKGWELQHNGTARHGRLTLPGVGAVKVRLHRPLGGEVLSLAIGRQDGEWLACFTCRLDSDPIPAGAEAVGVDVGVHYLATDSEGRSYGNGKAFRQSERALRRARQRVARCEPGSRRQQRARAALQRAELHVIRSRRDVAHKIARGLVDRYDLIAVEDHGKLRALDPSAHREPLARATWGLLFRALAEKAAAAGRVLVPVSMHQTSSECSACGFVGKKKAPSERQHLCPECGLSLSRDQNAAVNIRQRGLALEIARAEQGWQEAGRVANSLLA